YGSIQSSGFDWSFTAMQRGVTSPAAGATPKRSVRGPSTTAYMYGGDDLPVRLVFSRKTAFGMVMVVPDTSKNATTPFANARVGAFTLIGTSGPWSFPFPAGSDSAPAEADDEDSADADSGES